MAGRKRFTRADPTALTAVGEADRTDLRNTPEGTWQEELERRHAQSQARAAAIREARDKAAQ